MSIVQPLLKPILFALLCLNELLEQQVHAMLAVVTRIALRRVPEPVMTPIDPVSLFSPHLEISKG